MITTLYYLYIILTILYQIIENTFLPKNTEVSPDSFGGDMDKHNAYIKSGGDVEKDNAILESQKAAATV